MKTSFYNNPNFDANAGTSQQDGGKSFSTVINFSNINNPFKHPVSTFFLEDSILQGQPTDVSANNLHPLVAQWWEPLSKQLPFLKVYPPLGAKAEHKLPLWA